MFRRADEVWLEEGSGSLPSHVLGFQWEEFEPVLTLLDRASGEVVEGPVRSADIDVSEVKCCVGRFDGDAHVPCPALAPVDKFYQCEECAGESFIPVQQCIFEPRCDGEECDSDFCRREHVLYLAFHGCRPKVGLSSTRRVERRLIEQGADAFALLGTYPTRRRARTAEKEISSRLRVPQSHRQDALLRQLTSPVDRAAIEELYGSLRERAASGFSLEPGAIHWLSGYPVELPLPQVPRLVDLPGMHRGELLGLKGRWMFSRSAEGIEALDMSGLPSRFVRLR
jgi:hypothetical protein